MSYSSSPRVVDRVKHHLEVLLLAEEESVFFEHDNPSKFAYRLREAFFASKLNDEFDRFSRLKEDWKVLVSSRGVECRRKEAGRVVAPTQQVSSITLTEITRLTGVLSAALRYKVAEELVFPNVELNPNDQLKLYRWTGQHDWQYIDHMGEGITLTKHEVDLELLWEPPERRNG